MQSCDAHNSHILRRYKAWKQKKTYALKYLSNAVAYTPLESLSDSQKQALAFDLGLAALCGEKIYQFGELLLHPILNALEGTPGQWLVSMLEVCVRVCGICVAGGPASLYVHAGACMYAVVCVQQD